MADQPTLGAQVSAYIERQVRRYLAKPTKAKTLRDLARGILPPATVGKADSVLGDPRKVSYRDGLILQSAYGLLQPGLDLTKRQTGGRAVAERLGSLLRESHIHAVVDAFQNIGKNSMELCRGNVPAFDELLRWATCAPRRELRALFVYMTASTSLAARPIDPMPKLDNQRLTFCAVTGLLDELLDTPSAGAHEQFAVAAVLEALLDEMGQGGVGGLRVETKRLNASDASSGQVGDIQVKRGNRTEEAFEVSASDWREKVAQARALVRSADLSHAHVIAAAEGQRFGDAKELAVSEDISVIDTRAFLRVLTAVMRRPARAQALGRLYEHLDRNQPDPNRVNAYVALLKRRGLPA